MAMISSDVWSETAAKLRCPRCHGRDVTVTLAGKDSAPLDDGTVACRGCGATMEIIDGMIDARGVLPEPLRRESRQWEVFAQSEDWLAPPEEYLLTLPRPTVTVPGDTLTWPVHAWNFEQMLDRVDVAGKRVLDVAAGRCWSTRLLCERGARCTATDIMEHPTIGLGVGELLFRRRSIYFERVLCDMADMPFADETFDVVWLSGSLHHTIDLRRTIEELRRVLVPGGTIVLVNEAASAATAREVCQPTGAQEGINEHEYRTWRYLFYLRRAGFHDFRFMHDHHAFHYRPHRRAQRWLRPIARRWLPLYVLDLLLWGGVLCMTAKRA